MTAYDICLWNKCACFCWVINISWFCTFVCALKYKGCVVCAFGWYKNKSFYIHIVQLIYGIRANSLRFVAIDPLRVHIINIHLCVWIQMRAYSLSNFCHNKLSTRYTLRMYEKSVQPLTCIEEFLEK